MIKLDLSIIFQSKENNNRVKQAFKLLPNLNHGVVSIPRPAESEESEDMMKLKASGPGQFKKQLRL